jgi:hypothetical protein
MANQNAPPLDKPRMNWKMASLARAVISIIGIWADQWSKLDLALLI